MLKFFETHLYAAFPGNGLLRANGFNSVFTDKATNDKGKKTNGN
jgi:hypothetical protein